MVDLDSHQLAFELETRSLSLNLTWSLFQHLENRRKMSYLEKFA
jgi:hypothetical protein